MPSEAKTKPSEAKTKPSEAKTKPKVDTKRAWREARALLYDHRKSLTIGLVLMLISRAAGLVLPASTTCSRPWPSPPARRLWCRPSPATPTPRW